MSDRDERDSLWPSVLACYDLSLEKTSDNLALDEALLAAVEADERRACLRFWDPADYCVVVGRSNNIETEVNVAACAADRIPIFRRASGGGTVMIGPGCLCYSLALPMNESLRALGVSKVTDQLMSRSATALNSVLTQVEVCGTSDLVINGVKFSGNAQRRLQRSLIQHGTLLFDFDLTLIDRYLTHPSSEPGYRNSRPHFEFVRNVSLESQQLKSLLCSAWNAIPAECPASIRQDAVSIAAARYGSAEWQVPISS